jgi:hypothetical protein
MQVNRVCDGWVLFVLILFFGGFERMAAFEVLFSGALGEGICH